MHYDQMMWLCMRNKDHIWHRYFPYNFIKKIPTENIICEFHQTLIWMKSRYDSYKNVTCMVQSHTVQSWDIRRGIKLSNGDSIRWSMIDSFRWSLFDHTGDVSYLIIDREAINLKISMIFLTSTNTIRLMHYEPYRV